MSYQENRAPEAAHCPDEVCLTCSDQAVPARVIELRPPGLALVDTGDGQEEISVALVYAGAGDLVLVHAKEAIAVIGPDDTVSAVHAAGTAHHRQPRATP
jgi:hydrogenase maturation factor